MESNSNGQAPTHDVCSGRKGADQPHCYHSTGAPAQSGAVVVFSSLCCWCTPSWHHLDVFMPATLPVEEVVAASYQHGPLVTLRQSPKRGPSIARL